MTLEEALQALQRKGLNILFSSDLVSRDMMVATEPDGASPRQVLDALVKPHGLKIREGLGGALLVVEDHDSAASPTSAAKSADLRSVNPEYVIVPYVNIYLTARGSGSRYVDYLNQGHFTLFEDGRQLPISEFRTPQDSNPESAPAQENPLSIVVLIDMSESMENAVNPIANYDVLKQTMETLLDTLESSDRLMLFGFNQACWMITGSGADRSSFRRNMQQMGIVGGTTSLFDSILYGSQEVQKLPGRHLIILYSDGRDTSSHSSLEEVLAGLQANDVGLFAIETQRKSSMNHDVLRKLTEETGGSLFSPGNPAEISSLAHSIRDAIHGQYTIGYVPPNPNVHKWRRVEIKCNVPGIQLSYRKSYLF